MKEWDNGEGQIFFSAEETCSVIEQYYKEYEGEGPVLYLEKIELTKKPEEHLLYMN